MNTSTTQHKGQDVGYIRVSTTDQNTARQLEGAALDRVFTDKASGKDRQRPQLVACMAHLREGDRLQSYASGQSKGNPRLRLPRLMASAGRRCTRTCAGLRLPNF